MIEGKENGCQGIGCGAKASAGGVWCKRHRLMLKFAHKSILEETESAVRGTSAWCLAVRQAQEKIAIVDVGVTSQQELFNDRK